MRIDTKEKWLPIFDALASDVRLKIIQLLSDNLMNIKEIAEALSLSSAIITMHIRKLEKAGIVKSERTRSKSGLQKICSLAVHHLEIDLPSLKESEKSFHEFTLPIGQYTDFYATPTCGLATTEKVIGYFDDPRYFMDPERVKANILWLTQGYVEYTIPNYLLASQTPEELQITMELGSEAPGYNDNWPSDISFFFNGIHLGHWTSPGDFAGDRGIYTPSWWNNNVNQYGMLKILRITNEGTFIDGQKISEVKLEELHLEKRFWTFRIAVLKDAKHVGGMTIYGKGFGNYDEDILVRIFYKQKIE